MATLQGNTPLMQQEAATIVANTNAKTFEPTEIDTAQRKYFEKVETGEMSYRKRVTQARKLYRRGKKLGTRLSNAETHLERVRKCHSELQLRIAQYLYEIKNHPEGRARGAWSAAVQSIGIHNRTEADRLVSGYELFSDMPPVIQAAMVEAGVSPQRKLIAEIAQSLKHEIAFDDADPSSPEFRSRCVSMFLNSRKGSGKLTSPRSEASFLQTVLRTFEKLPSNAREARFKAMVFTLAEILHVSVQTDPASRTLTITPRSEAIVPPTAVANVANSPETISVSG